LGWIGETLFTQVFRVMIGLNFILFFLNLLPMPPLDGGALLEWLMPRSALVYFLSRWGFVVLLALSFMGALRIVLTPAQLTSDAWQSILQRAAGL
jgi:Zn-dependent protease